MVEWDGAKSWRKVARAGMYRGRWGREGRPRLQAVVRGASPLAPTPRTTRETPSLARDPQCPGVARAGSSVRMQPCQCESHALDTTISHACACPIPGRVPRRRRARGVLPASSPHGRWGPRPPRQRCSRAQARSTSHGRCAARTEEETPWRSGWRWVFAVTATRAERSGQAPTGLFPQCSATTRRVDVPVE